MELQGKHPPTEQQEQVMDFQLASLQSTSENCRSLAHSLFSDSDFKHLYLVTIT